MPQWLLRTAGFTVLYVLATYVGRLTIMDGTNLSLVWPAAAIAAMRFVSQRDSPWRLLRAAAPAAATMAVHLAANLLQAWLFAYLLGRWLPDVWGSGGTAQVARPPGSTTPPPPLTGLKATHLWRLTAIAVLSTLSGALVGPTGVWLVTGHYSV